MRQWKVLITIYIIFLAFSISCGDNVYESLIEAENRLLLQEKDYEIDPDLQNKVFIAGRSVQGGSEINITGAGSSEYEVWFAPLNTTEFVQGPGMTSISGDSTTITAPSDDGDYHLYIVYPDGTISDPSNAVLTVDNIPPAVTEISTSYTGPAGIGDEIVFTVTLDEAIDIPAADSIEIALNNGGTVIVTGPRNGTELSGIYTIGPSDTSTSALGLDTSALITANGIFTDEAGNILNQAVPDSRIITDGVIEVDTIPPDNQDVVFAVSSRAQGDTGVSIMSAGDTGYSVWFAPSGITDSSQFIEGPAMTIGEGTAESIQSPQNEGTYYLYVVDAAGNISAASTADLTVDNEALAPDIPDLSAADDSGFSDSDDITSRTTELTFSGTSENNASIEIFDGLISLGTAAADESGNWTADLDLSPGTYTINAVQIDAAGNESPPSGNLIVIVDTSASSTSIPVLSASDDMGISDSDNITNRTAGLTFTGTSENNASIEIFNGIISKGTTTADGAGDWSIDLDLSPGTYAVNAVQTDLAGNVSIESGSLSLTIDTSIAPTSAPDLDSTDDSGISDADNITSRITGLTFTGTSENNASIEIFDDVISKGTTTADGSGSWSIDLDLSPGGYSINAVQTDIAGNTSPPSTSLSLTIDTSGPSAEINGEPTGINNITELSVSISGTDVQNYKYALGTGAMDCSNSGNYSVEMSIGTDITDDIGSSGLDLPDGQIKLCAVGKDTAGNWQEYTDATVVQWEKNASAVTAEVSGQPSGFSNILVLDATVSGTDVQNYRYALGTSALDCSIEGNYSAPIAVGTKITDDIGPTGLDLSDGQIKLCVVGQNSVTTWQDFNSATSKIWTKDTIVSAPGVPDLADVDDTGISDSDNITNKTTGLTFTGTSENNASIEIFDDVISKGTTTANGSGDWTIDLDLSADTYSINAVQIDPAGNVSTASGSLSLTIDNTKPTVTIGAPDDTLINSSGNSTFELTYDFAPSPALASGDITVNTTGTVSCSAVNVADGLTDTPDVTVSNCTGDGTFTITVAAAQSADLAGNTDDGDGPSAAVTVDNTKPTVVIGAPDDTLINSTGNSTFEITYEVAPSPALASGDITVNETGVSCSTINVVDGSTTTPEVTISGCTGDGSFTISVAASQSADLAGNTDNGAGPSASVTVDNTKPTVVIGVPDDTMINSTGNSTFEITYEAAPSPALVSGDITVNTTGTVGCSTVNVADGLTTTPDVTVSNCTGDGTFTITVAAAQSVDLAGNTDNGDGPSAAVTVDNTKPTVTIGSPDDTMINSSGNSTFELTYDFAPSPALVSGDITVNTTGTVSCSTVNVAAGLTTTPDVTVSGCTGDGTFTISVAAAQSVDLAGNTDDGDGPSAAVTVDNTKPTVTIGAPDDTLINSIGNSTFELTYDFAPSPALASGDITVNTTGTVSCSTINVADGLTTTPDVTVSNCTGDGTFTISVAAAQSADLAGNTDDGDGPSASVTVDNTKPAVAIGAPGDTLINSTGNSTFELTYDFAPSPALASGDITVNTTGTASCSTINVVDGSTTTPEVTISGCTGDGTFTITVAAAQSADLAGNTDNGAGPSAAVTVDNTKPTVVIGAPDDTMINSTGNSTFEITYEVAPSPALASGDITVNTTGTVSCSTINVADGGTTTPDVTVSSCTGDGTFTISVSAAQSVDLAGNTDDGAGPSSAVTVDNTKPAVVIGAPDDTMINSTGNSTFELTYDFVPSPALASGDITVNETGVSCSTINVADGGTTTPDVTVSNCTGDGTFTITVVAAQSVDTAGNTDNGAGPSSAVTVDNTKPSVAIGAPDDTMINSAGNSTFELTYDFAPSPALASGDITVNETGVSCSTTNVVDGGTTTPEVTISGCTGDGTFTISVAAAQSSDLAGNTDNGAGPSASVTVDNTKPTVAIGAPDDTLINSTGSSTYILTYDFAPSPALGSGDITVNETGVSCSTINVVDGGTTTPEVTISGCTGDGTFTISVAAAQSADLAGNTDNGAGPSASVTVDNTKPAVAIGPPSSTEINSSGSSIFTLTYDYAPSPALVAGDITVSETGVSCSTVNVADGGTITPDVTISDCTGDGSFTISVAAAQSADPAGNTDNGAGPSSAVTVDNTDPTVAIGLPTESYINSTGTSDYPITYTGADTVNLTTGDVTVNTGGDASCTKSVLNGTTSTPTVRLTGCTGDGAADIEITAGTSSDDAGNTDAGDNTSTAFNVDNTDPVISSAAPVSSASVNNTLVSYTLSEIADTASITWTRAGGSADGSSPHAQSLTGSELNAGAHNNITITNNPTLVDGAVYDISFNCADRAGNTATTVTSTSVTFTDAPLTIVTADTLDADNNGKIDTYKLAFNKSVNDSTFPGYIINSLGTMTSEWLVAGYTNVRLIHGTAVSFATDTINDAVIYVRFAESPTTCDSSDQAGCDTGAKPDLTTTASPALEDLATNALSQVQSADVTEADGAKPLLITAKSLNANEADVIFSEAMEETTAETSAYYTIDLGVTVSDATRDDVNNKVVHLATSNQTGGTTYTLTVNTDVKDMANFSLDPSANTVQFDGNVKPIVVSIETVNTTTLTITFNETVTRASAECSNLTECGAIYDSVSLPIKSAVSTNPGNDMATYTLTVNDMIEGQNYTTTVIEDTVTSVASGFKMGTENNSATFSGDGRPGAYISADTESECPSPSNLPPSSPAQTRVVVQYDQAVSATALTTSNYKITLCQENPPCSSGTGSPNDAGATAVTNMGGNKYAVDFSDTFDSDTSVYQLNITGVTDPNGNEVTAPSNHNFQCGSDDNPPSLINAEVTYAETNATQVMLTFSESVDQVTANTTSNYKYDTLAWDASVDTAARQANYAEVLVTFVPGIPNGGHQISVRNVQDLAVTPNTILNNGINNVQPIIVNAPEGLDEGEVFEDPFGDGTAAAYIVKYNSMLYLGTDDYATKLFEMDYGLTTSQAILIDADGSAGAPVEQFFDYSSDYSGTVKGIDALYAACIGGTATPDLTGSACTDASGDEKLFIGSLNVTGNYISYWETSDKSTSTTTFTLTEGDNPDTGGGVAFRSTVFVVFKDYLWNHFGAEGGGGGRGGRICVNPAGCSDGNGYKAGVRLRPQRYTRIGNTVNGTGIGNGSKSEITGLNHLNAINVAYEHDNDGAGVNESQLYFGNGGIYTGLIGSARSGHSDGGIIRTKLAYSTKSSLPLDCNSWDGNCDQYWEDITPDATDDWNNYISIPLPQNSAVTGEANCSSSGIEMDCSRPYNIFTPSLKAIPYMRTAPNGDLYMLRNACSSQKVCVNGAADITGFGGCEFETERQVCPAGNIQS